MRAFTKMGTEPLGDRSASLTAPFVFYLDNSLLEEGWEAELTPQGLVLVNTPQASTHQRLLPLDADALSTGVLGHPFPNTAFLGAFPAVCDALTLDHVEEGIRLTMPSRLAAKNIAVARAAYEACLKSVKGGAHD
jgi:pyruvate ferredoxin oxidoreductase gamma subunit